MNIAIEQEMLPPADFAAALVERVDRYVFADTRLSALLDSGRCPESIVLRYALATYHSADLFCATIAEMVDKAPNTKARLILLENLLEEEGIFLNPAKGLVVRPATRHPALALRFLEACGGHADMVRPETRHATAPGRKLLADGRWVEAVAHLLVGQELKFGVASLQLFEALRKTGLSAHDLAFFKVHSTADCEHGEQALALVVENCTTRAEQGAALTAAEDGARIWFEMHGGANQRAAARTPIAA